MRPLHRCLRHGDDQDQPPTGLIGYDTDQAIKARECGTTPPPIRTIRARTLVYVGVIVAVAMTMLYSLATRSLMDVSAIHERTPLFTVLRDGSVRNNYTLRLANKRPKRASSRWLWRV